ncbi:hypothetical protein [Streptomyces tricolor]|uniref:hypothetical protein n=1 Tax=Streptomyces tricolor TaxID=68277 RepID=UPI0036EA1A74
MTELIGHSATPARLPGGGAAFNSTGYRAGGRELPSAHARVGPDTNAQQREYTTFAPAGEKCRRCHRPFGSLEAVRRVQPSGEEPSGRPYACIECSSGGAS